jgi:Asp-tRNA(Asn)/Glu-tRNA(Gln) amidotransferase A subunit family amidase
MFIHSAPLAPIASALRSGELDLQRYIDETCDRIDALEPQLQALLPEPDRRQRLQNEAKALQQQWPQPGNRPSLYGVLTGVKDVFRADGFPTHAGSQLPPELFAGPEATCVTRLRNAGVLILGKTVTTEFAWAEPGPTRNPHNHEHTPGGSSSGSAAAVAAGFCSLALGTQTIGSTIRPASFCGIVGFKPSYGRIPTDGLILFSKSVDTVGIFTQDVEGMELTASLLCDGWQPALRPERLPILGVPEGPYLEQTTPEGLTAFQQQLAQLEKAGYTIKRVRMFEDIETINRQHTRMAFAELAQVHADWFAQYEALYRPKTVAAIREGQSISQGELEASRAGRLQLRTKLEAAMDENGIDLWVSPAAPGPAPKGLSATGSTLLNLPWTYAGMPAISLPMGRAENGLPMGLQVVGKYMGDELLLAWAKTFSIEWKAQEE